MIWLLPSNDDATVACFPNQSTVVSSFHQWYRLAVLPLIQPSIPAIYLYILSLLEYINIYIDTPTHTSIYVPVH